MVLSLSLHFRFRIFSKVLMSLCAKITHFNFCGVWKRQKTKSKKKKQNKTKKDKNKTKQKQKQKKTKQKQKQKQNKSQNKSKIKTFCSIENLFTISLMNIHYSLINC